MKHTKNFSKLIIKLFQVGKTYRMGTVTLDVLKNISLSIHQNEFIAIVGASGSGKSTLMNLLGMLDTPSTGKIIVDNKDISDLSESALAQIRGQKIGFIFQQFNLIPTLTALENVVLPTIFQNMPENQRVEKAKSLLTQVGLGERMHHKPMELSGGQQQRVSIARALVNNPSIILADEPTGNLDSKSGQQVIGILEQLHRQEQKTIILVTHDLSLINRARLVIHLKDGEISKLEKN